MRNWQASKRQIIRKSTKTDDVLTIVFEKYQFRFRKDHNAEHYLH